VKRSLFGNRLARERDCFRSTLPLYTGGGHMSAMVAMKNSVGAVGGAAHRLNHIAKSALDTNQSWAEDRAVFCIAKT